MPELPEVETIRRVLEKKIGGRAIRAVHLHVPNSRGSRLTHTLARQSRTLARRLRGQRIQCLGRRAKYLLLEVKAGTLVVHLGMTGQLFAALRGEKPCCGEAPLPDKHTHLVLDLSGGARVFFRDARKFGSIRWLERGEIVKEFVKLGPEPLGREFTPQQLKAGLRQKRAPVKALLLNQKLVAGLGNIYADEALFLAGLAPHRPGLRVTASEAERLHAAIRSVLREAIRYRGTTLSDYFDPENRRGAFRERLRVYGRAGEACLVCGTIISRRILAQRSTHWCRHCQK